MTVIADLLTAPKALDKSCVRCLQGIPDFDYPSGVSSPHSAKAVIVALSLSTSRPFCHAISDHVARLLCKEAGFQGDSESDLLTQLGL